MSSHLFPSLIKTHRTSSLLVYLRHQREQSLPVTRRSIYFKRKKEPSLYFDHVFMSSKRTNRTTGPVICLRQKEDQVVAVVRSSVYVINRAEMTSSVYVSKQNEFYQ